MVAPHANTGSMENCSEGPYPAHTVDLSRYNASVFCTSSVWCAPYVEPSNNFVGAIAGAGLSLVFLASLGLQFNTLVPRPDAISIGTLRLVLFIATFVVFFATLLIFFAGLRRPAKTRQLGALLLNADEQGQTDARLPVY